MASKDKAAQKETPETQKEDKAKIDPKISDAFSTAQSAGKNDDEIKMAMIKAGATFKNVSRFFQELMVGAGLAMSKDERDKIVDKICKGRKLENEDSFDKAVAKVVEEVTGADAKTAGSLIRAWGKKNEVAVFQKPKGEGKGKSGFASKFYAFLIQNPKVSAEKAKAFVMGTDGNAETSDNVKKHLSHYMGVAKLVNDVANAK